MNFLFKQKDLQEQIKLIIIASINSWAALKQEQDNLDINVYADEVSKAFVNELTILNTTNMTKQ